MSKAIEYLKSKGLLNEQNDFISDLNRMRSLKKHDKEKLVWFECASSNDDRKRPQNATEADMFMKDIKLFIDDIWHRYITTRSGSKKFVNWLKDAWYFENFTKSQLEKIYNSIEWGS